VSRHPGPRVAIPACRSAPPAPSAPHRRGVERRTRGRRPRALWPACRRSCSRARATAAGFHALGRAAVPQDDRRPLPLRVLQASVRARGRQMLGTDEQRERRSRLLLIGGSRSARSLAAVLADCSVGRHPIARTHHLPSASPRPRSAPGRPDRPATPQPYGVVWGGSLPTPLARRTAASSPMRRSSIGMSIGSGSTVSWNLGKSRWPQPRTSLSRR
jgi:hypothetical protein